MIRFSASKDAHAKATTRTYLAELGTGVGQAVDQQQHAAFSL